jgi:chromosome segregation ATPase
VGDESRKVRVEFCPLSGASNDTPTEKRGIGSSVTRELDQLRKKVTDLTLRLEREVNPRELSARLVAEAKKVRAQLSGQIKTLSKGGRKLASQLNSALRDASKPERLHQGALAKIAELKAELASKTADLKGRSQELSKLARESAHRAAAIVRGGGQPTTAPSRAKPSKMLTPSESGPEEHSKDQPKLT